MLSVLIFVNIVAFMAWLHLVGITAFTWKVLRCLRIRIDKKRKFFTYLIIPIFVLSFFYFALLLVWIIIDYDKIINPYVSLAWSIFHILTPIVLSLFVSYIKLLLPKL